MANAADTVKSAIKGHVRSDVKLTGKTVLITGANQGIGYETALDLAGREAKVIIACRDLEKAEAAKNKITAKFPNSSVVITKLDLASLQSVRDCAKLIRESEEHLDILINNAGVMACPQSKTEEGYELQFGTNHLGHFLLTKLLLPLIKQSEPSRIIIVSSSGYKRGRMNWSDMMHEKAYSPFNVYFDSKLANVLHCTELAKRLQETEVTCNCLHPGLIKTNLGQHLRGSHTPFFHRMMYKVFWPLTHAVFSSAKTGAQTSIYCAIAPELEGVSGKYFSKCAEEELIPHAKSHEDAVTLFAMSEEWVKEFSEEFVMDKRKSNSGKKSWKNKILG